MDEDFGHFELIWERFYATLASGEREIFTRKLKRDAKVSSKPSDLTSVEKKKQHLRSFYKGIWECGRKKCLDDTGNYRVQGFYTALEK